MIERWLRAALRSLMQYWRNRDHSPKRYVAGTRKAWYDELEADEWEHQKPVEVEDDNLD